MGQSVSRRTKHLESFKELSEAVSGTHREVVQLDPGLLRGRLTHLSVGGLPVDVGNFSVGVRSRGVPSRDKVLIGVLTGSTGRATQWSRDMHRGDVIVTPPGGEHDARYYGGASFAVIALSFAEIHDFFSGEAWLQDIEFWQRKIVSPAGASKEYILSRLSGILARLQNHDTMLTKNEADFWRRSVIEAMTAAATLESPNDVTLPSSANIVGKVEDYLDQSDMPLVHISQICNALNVSRRTLHRGFHDAIGMGPVAFLQRRRLCSVHSALRQSDPATTTIAEIALQHGFVNLGRFSGYYRSLFAEYPSETFGGHTPRKSRSSWRTVTRTPAAAPGSSASAQSRRRR